MTISLTVEGMALSFIVGTIGAVIGRLIADKIQSWLDERRGKR